MLVLDDTGLSKQGEGTVGVARQYSGTLGKVGNCQVAVTYCEADPQASLIAVIKQLSPAELREFMQHL